MNQVFSIWDVVLTPIYLAIIFFISNIIQKRNIQKHEYYRYFQAGLFAKFIGGISLVLVYTQYYSGGDTINYYEQSIVLLKMFTKDTGTFFSILSGNLTSENRSMFDESTGYPIEYWNDSASYTVVRLTSIIEIFSFRSLLVSTILIGLLSYIGSWRLFLLFCNLFPTLSKQFSFALLFFPSVLFWGSGILKDTYTLMAASWYTYSFYYGLIKPRKVFLNWLIMIIMAIIMISIKPYIFIALMPGTLIWLSFEKAKTIKNWFFRILTGPILVSLITLVGYFLFMTVGSNLGQFSSSEKIFNKAIATQQDLKQSYYQGNSFDIGDYDASFSGVLSKFPEATTAGLFRPFIWEARNIMMVIAGLENIILLGLTIYLLFKVGIIGLFKNIGKEPIVFFSLIFAVFFAFSVGISTSNFGAMVRYKIPCIPFYLSSLIILNHFYAESKKKNT